MPTYWLVTAITYNMGGRATAEDLRKLITLAQSKTPDSWAIALQETADKRTALQHVVDLFSRRTPDSALKGAVADPRVALVQGPKGLGRSKCALLLPAGTVREDGLWKISDRTFVGEPGAGGSWTDHKYVTWAKTRSGGVGLNVGSVHLMSSVQGSKTWWRPRRQRIHRAQSIAAMAWERSRTGTGPVVLLGDFNATPESAMMKPFRDQGYRTYGDGSHGGKGKDKRAIDLLVTDHRRVEVTGVEALKGYGSDHRPVVFDLRVKARPVMSRG